MSKTKWTDERIKEMSIGIVSRNLMTQIRDDMQAEIDALRLQNETLRHQLDELAKLAIRKPRDEWQPVDTTAFDIAETSLNPALELHDGHIIVLRQSASDLKEANEMSVDLGDEYTICRLAEFCEAT